MNNQLKAPSRFRILLEFFSFIEFFKLLFYIPFLLNLPKTNLENIKIIVLPGYKFGDNSTVLLRMFLRFLKYNVTGWGLGVNNGNIKHYQKNIINMIEKDPSNQFILIGWSLGGCIAREVARENSSKLEMIITLGSQIIGGPKYTSTAQSYIKKGFDLDKIEKDIDQLSNTLINIPIHAIFSKRDGIVSWEACIDKKEKMVQHFEVNSFHFGLVLSHQVFTSIAMCLNKLH
jgi:hypothetical protein